MLTMSKEKQIWNAGKIQSKEYNWTKRILGDSKWPDPCSMRKKRFILNKYMENIYSSKT